MGDDEDEALMETYNPRRDTSQPTLFILVYPECGLKQERADADIFLCLLEIWSDAGGGSSGNF